MGRWRQYVIWKAITGSVALAMVVAACGGGGEMPAAGNTAEPQATAVASSQAAQGQATPVTSVARATGSLPGQVAIGFTLPSARGPEVALAGYQGRKNVVLVFYRAFW